MSKGRRQNWRMKIDKENQIPSPGSAGQNATGRNLEWWEALTSGERKLICSLMRMLRGAKRSQLRDVAVAAKKWERGLGCFIKVRLMNGYKPGRNSKRKSGGVCITVAADPRNN
jgi:hypothetical protein